MLMKLKQKKNKNYLWDKKINYNTYRYIYIKNVQLLNGYVMVYVRNYVHEH